MSMLLQILEGLQFLTFSCIREGISCHPRVITVPYPPQFLITPHKPSYIVPFDQRQFLFSFAGKFDRHEEGGKVYPSVSGGSRVYHWYSHFRLCKVRGSLKELTTNVSLLMDGVILREIHANYKYTDRDFIYYRDTLAQSKFCLVPRGDSPQTQHLFSSLVCTAI